MRFHVFFEGGTLAIEEDTQNLPVYAPISPPLPTSYSPSNTPGTYIYFDICRHCHIFCFLEARLLPTSAADEMGKDDNPKSEKIYIFSQLFVIAIFQFRQRRSTRRNLTVRALFFLLRRTGKEMARVKNRFLISVCLNCTIFFQSLPLSHFSSAQISSALRRQFQRPPIPLSPFAPLQPLLSLPELAGAQE